MQTTAIALFSTFWLATACQAQPLGERLRYLDGVITETEQAASTLLLEEEEAAIFFDEADGLIALRVKTKPLYVASLCLASASGVWVLHASAALDAVVYTPQGEGWNPDEDFEWGMRGTAMTEAALNARRHYLEVNGWVATTMDMGRPGEVEFLLHPGALPAGDLFLAAGLMPSEDPENILALPAATAGDCADAGLVGGSARRGLRFQPETWQKVALP